MSVLGVLGVLVVLVVLLLLLLNEAFSNHGALILICIHVGYVWHSFTLGFRSLGIGRKAMRDNGWPLAGGVPSAQMLSLVCTCSTWCPFAESIFNNPVDVASRPSSTVGRAGADDPIPHPNHNASPRRAEFESQLELECCCCNGLCFFFQFPPPHHAPQLLS
ncbi:hypothetical protein FN846DRAFT_425306 [Sphaerosporella brunnea]|uniref:Uncharacterized protein n=1 Tax=Sphaerosporella brunnea TaxID=1250544 RepID=A0A5J5F534_9PEZI|nr:hypothetical protein FN846DRAFT_425306 [Sphaerosporella brunnea]